jgi:ABC-type polar amino acid transport system ATPase subunit
MLSIKNITKTFGDKKILNNVSVDVPKGGIAIFLGESGVGKSTLLRLLNNLETLQQGSITFDAIKLDPQTIHKNHIVGMVFQNFNLFNHLTILENVTLALEKVMGKTKKEAEVIARNLLAKYGLEDKVDKYPAQLSGGQKQRVALVRSLALKPKIICLDEPTSALDPFLTSSVAKIINELALEGLIVLIATHDTTIFDHLNATTPCTIYLMDSGKIVESISLNELLINLNQQTKDSKKESKILKFIAGQKE